MRIALWKQNLKNMKNLMRSSIAAICVIVLLSAFVMPSAIVEWERTTADFGTIKKGEPVSEKFFFTNKSDQPITIIKTKTSCGCTVTEHTKSEIAPGEKGYVKAQYNAAKVGAFTKTVQVFTSADENPFTLTIKGVVE
jgi:hypothetical protein